MKKFQLCGIGNGVVDILIEISEDELQELGVEKGSMRLVDSHEQQSILAKFKEREPHLASGGSVANSVIAFSQLGGRAAFMCCLGDDEYGSFYRKEFEDLGIQLGQCPVDKEPSGLSLIMISPDAERTMRTSLGVSSYLSANHIEPQLIKDSEWLFVEGYLLSNPETGQGAVAEAVKLANEFGTKIAVTFSDSWIVDNYRPALENVVQSAELLIANEREAATYTGVDDYHESFEAMKQLGTNVVITGGPQGAQIYFGGEAVEVPAFACEPTDLTGAGDMFAGAFLYGISQGLSPETAGRAACYMSAQVISQVGARLQVHPQRPWNEALSASPAN